LDNEEDANMRYAVILAGGSGTRLWPMSRAGLPKQLIPFIRGKSLLEIAVDRLRGLVDPGRQLICTGEKYRRSIREAMPGFAESRILGEPEGRDTLAAVGLPAAVAARQDPDAVIAVFTADHLIDPVDVFQDRVRLGFRIAEKVPSSLVTFGIRPTCAATGYGYVELGEPLEDFDGAYAAVKFVEKPDAETARRYLDSGGYAWNSGMFVWRAETLLGCIRRYRPQVHAGLVRIADAWDGPEQQAVLSEVYPTLEKISVDFAVMEPASTDDEVTVATVPMPVEWLDVGGWPAYAETLRPDADTNRSSSDRTLAIDSSNNLIVTSDPKHLVAALGVDDLVIVHTPDATLICHRDHAERIKELHKAIGERFGGEHL
jgi:mannose-1-phosphate guanylyltransferase